jgi:hypothetical protein
MQFSIEKRMVLPGLLGLGLLCSAFLAASCRGVSAPPDPPQGGGTYALSYSQFTETVAPVLTRLGCDAGGDCHGGGIRGTLQLSPPEAKDVRFDFDQVVLQVSVTDPVQSPILTEPLAQAAGGTPHGVEPFATTSDSDYVAIRTWIMSGLQP